MKSHEVHSIVKKFSKATYYSGDMVFLYCLYAEKETA